jgi:hypothetical protein
MACSADLWYNQGRILLCPDGASDTIRIMDRSYLPMSTMIPPVEKRCARCEQVKLAYYFNKNSTTPTGLATYCKMCEKDRLIGREVFPEGQKRCTDCGELRTIDQFFPNSECRDGYGYQCRLCCKEKHNQLIETFETAPGPRRRGPYNTTTHRGEVLPDEYKRCTSCKQVKPKTAFYTKPSTKDGLNPSCRDCSYVNHKAQTVNIPEIKQCTRCKETKPSIEFSLLNNVRRKGLNSWCRKCVAEHGRIYRKPRQAASIDGYLRRKLRQYGIAIEEYETMLVEQDGKCAICKHPETAIMNGKPMSLAVDHCHTTDAVRGLLCTNCNRALGLLQEDPERAE